MTYQEWATLNGIVIAIAALAAALVIYLVSRWRGSSKARGLFHATLAAGLVGLAGAGYLFLRLFSSIGS